MGYEILIEETRAGLVENVHFGIICGLNEEKEKIYQIGDPEQEVFFRSAAKPIQALPIFLSTIIEKYNLTEEEAALFAASHRGEENHISALKSMLNKLPVEETDLYCPPSYPLNREPREKMIRLGEQKRRLYHNCSGKHMGFVAVCKEMGYPVANYWEPNHPLQQHIAQILSTLSEVPISKIKIGIDGCGVPVFAIPLSSMALTYLKLACPDLIEDSKLRNAVQKLTNTMNHQYNMIASEHFICSVLLQDPNIVAKGGAQGVYCFGLKNERIAFALKVINGSEDVWPNIVASILDQIDYKNKETIQKLRRLKPSLVKNDSGIEVGAIKERFAL
ncbi:asparaginase [Heyndrickxia vini]|uniref:Asparaginase n=1 Tax=Heyndrickxia vini TaxID=1476025 RepID=A0ABX7E3I1_9BACI|nr:asparaginase [Heyndrickxia vini]QQZ10052.1 asparaginase [Heyndrickxia vini]